MTDFTMEVSSESSSEEDCIMYTNAAFRLNTLNQRPRKNASQKNDVNLETAKQTDSTILEDKTKSKEVPQKQSSGLANEEFLIENNLKDCKKFNDSLNAANINAASADQVTISDDENAAADCLLVNDNRGVTEDFEPLYPRRMTRNRRKARIIPVHMGPIILLDDGLEQSECSSLNNSLNPSQYEDDSCVFIDSPPSAQKEKDDDNCEVRVKVRWKSSKLERFEMQKDESFKKIFQHFAELEKISVDQIIITHKGKRISSFDSPASIKLSILDILDGGVVNEDIAKQCKESPQNSSSDKNLCKIKLQTSNNKTLSVSIKLDDPFAVLLHSCSEQLNVPKSKIKLFFDGDIVDINETPKDLDIDGEACFDLKISDADVNCDSFESMVVNDGTTTITANEDIDLSKESRKYDPQNDGDECINQLDTSAELSPIEIIDEDVLSPQIVEDCEEIGLGQSRDKDSCKIKIIQSLDKTPFIVFMNMNDPFFSIMSKCSEHFDEPEWKMKLVFHGKDINVTDTPNSLSIIDEAYFDLKISEPEVDSEVIDNENFDEKINAILLKYQNIDVGVTENKKINDHQSSPIILDDSLNMAGNDRSTASSPTKRNSVNSNSEVLVKICWKSFNVELFKMQTNESFQKVFKYFAKLESVSTDRILITKWDKHITQNDTPDSIGLSVTDILDGGVLSADVVHDAKKNSCKIKVQTSKTESFTVPMQFNDTFSILIHKCAEKLNVPESKIKLFFDGELVDLDDTPETLEIDDEACFDLKVSGSNRDPAETKNTANKSKNDENAPRITRKEDKGTEVPTNSPIFLDDDFGQGESNSGNQFESNTDDFIYIGSPPPSTKRENEDNFMLNVKVLWKSQVKHFEVLKHESFLKVFKFFAILEDVSLDRIAITKDGVHVSHKDTPASIKLTIVDVLEGSFVRNHASMKTSRKGEKETVVPESSSKSNFQKNSSDYICIGSPPPTKKRKSEDDHEMVNVKVKWKSAKVERFKISKHETFQKVFKFFIELENVSIDRIFITKKGVRISQMDTPASIGLSIIDILEGGVLSTNIVDSGKGNKSNQSCDQGSCKIKVQTSDKKTFVVPLKPDDPFSVLLQKCSQQLNVPESKIKLFCDGDVVDKDETPRILDIDDEACFDLKISD